jgi:hypothetical protein
MGLPNPFKALIDRFLGSSGSKAVDADDTQEAIDTTFELILDVNGEVVRLGASILLAGALLDLQAIAEGWAVYQTAQREYEKWKGRVEDKLALINKALDHAEVQRVISALRLTNTIALNLSPSYRQRVAEIETQIRQISREVFQDANTISAQLTILQMLTYDIARLEGKPQAEAENRFLTQSIQITDMVSRNARSYNRQPGLFWADLQTLYINPLYRDIAVAHRLQDGRLDQAISGIASVTETALGVDRRFTQYVAELREFVDPDKMRELDGIRRTYRRDVLEPLAAVIDAVDVAIPVIEQTVAANTESLVEQGARLEVVEVITGDPEGLTEEQQAFQLDRTGTIWASMLRDRVSGSDRLMAAKARQQSLYEALTEGR